MSLESATFISDLNSSNPPGGDNVAQADDHIRLLKATIKATFPSITGAVNASQAQLNNLNSIAALSILGNGTNGAAAPTALAAGTDGHVLRRSGTAVSFGKVANAGIADSAIRDVNVYDRSASSVWGRSAATDGPINDIVAASNDQVLRRTANVVGFGTVDTGGITAKAITYAKMQDISATQRVHGRNTAAAGVTEEVTLSQLLDWIGSAAQGDILYRGAASWARLAAGTSGQILQTGGAGANPSWITAASNAGPTPLVILSIANARYRPAGTFGNTNAAIAANTLYAVPWYNPAQTTFTKISIRVTTLSAGNVRLGIFNDVNGHPGTVLVDCGTASTASTGLKEIAFSQAIAPGWYWFGAVFSGTPTINTNTSTFGSSDASSPTSASIDSYIRAFAYAPLVDETAQTYALGIVAPITLIGTT